MRYNGTTLRDKIASLLTVIDKLEEENKVLKEKISRLKEK